MNERTALVEQLHGLPCSGVIALTGGGALLLADLLTVSGASATVLEARVPYAAAALADFIGATPERACSVETACDIAMAGWTRALAIGRRRAATPLRSRLHGEPRDDGAQARRASRAHRAADARRNARVVVDADQGRTRSLGGGTTRRGYRANGARRDVRHRRGARLWRCVDGESIDTERAVAPPQWGDILLGRERAVPVNQNATPSRAVSRRVQSVARRSPCDGAIRGQGIRRAGGVRDLRQQCR